MLKQFVVGVAVAVALTGLAVAGALEEATTAYERGDYPTALRLWRPLAEEGHADAQYSLGELYRAGMGVPRDFAEAAKWYRLAADQGDATAQHVLGRLYFTGKGVPEDDAEAVKWYRLAADQGDASAQYDLGIMYNNGYGVPQDYVLAHMWLNLSAAREEGARIQRDSVAKHMTPDQIAEAQRLAREWKPVAER